MKPTNSRRHENLDLRERYREDNPDCELTPFLCGTRWNKIKLAFSWRWDKGRECHHIYRVGARYDYLENFITLCPAAHKFCHTGPEGLIACWYAKSRKTPSEFDPESMRVWMGRCPLGMIEMYLSRVDEHYVRMGRELLG